MNKQKILKYKIKSLEKQKGGSEYILSPDNIDSYDNLNIGNTYKIIYLKKIDESKDEVEINSFKNSNILILGKIFQYYPLIKSITFCKISDKNKKYKLALNDYSIKLVDVDIKKELEELEQKQKLKLEQDELEQKLKQEQYELEQKLSNITTLTPVSSTPNINSLSSNYQTDDIVDVKINPYDDKWHRGKIIKNIGDQYDVILEENNKKLYGVPNINLKKISESVQLVPSILSRINNLIEQGNDASYDNEQKAIEFYSQAIDIANLNNIKNDAELAHRFRVISYCSHNKTEKCIKDLELYRKNNYEKPWKFEKDTNLNSIVKEYIETENAKAKQLNKVKDVEVVKADEKPEEPEESEEYDWDQEINVRVVEDNKNKDTNVKLNSSSSSIPKFKVKNIQQTEEQKKKSEQTKKEKEEKKKAKEKQEREALKLKPIERKYKVPELSESDRLSAEYGLYPNRNKNRNNRNNNKKK